MKRLTLLAILITAGLVAVGCGDDGEDDTAAEQTTTEGAAPAKEEFIAEADKICAQGDAEIDDEAQEVFGEGPASPEEGEQFVTETVVPSIRGQIDRIGELTPPEGDKQTITEFLDSAQSALDRIEENPSLIAEQPQTGADPFAETTQLASDYGFQKCAQ